MKYIVMFMLLLLSSSVQAIQWNGCTYLMESIASEDISDETGSISQAYDCESGTLTVISSINHRIKPDAVINASGSFIDNYCLNLSKNYLLSDPTSREMMKQIFRGGVRYIVKHPLIESRISYKKLDECLEYVQIMESQLPENPYEQTKFIRKFTSSVKKP